MTYFNDVLLLILSTMYFAAVLYTPMDTETLKDSFNKPLHMCFNCIIDGRRFTKKFVAKSHYIKTYEVCDETMNIYEV